MVDDLKSQISETMKKIVLTGVGTIFMTEETIRNILGDIKLPKDMWGGFLENAAKTKSEFLTTFAKEAAQVLNKVDLNAEVQKLLEGQKMKISVEVSFEPKAGSLQKKSK